MKRAVKIILTAFLALFLALLFAPYLFHQKFINMVEAQMEKYVDAEIEFEDADLSFIRNFPAICVAFDSLTMEGRGQFEDIYLLKAQRSSFTTDWKSVLRPAKGIYIHEIEINDADIEMLIDSNGVANFDIWKERKEEKQFYGSIDYYELNESNISYEDRTTGLKIVMVNIDHEGNGRFDHVNFDLNTETEIESLTVGYQGISYLKKARLAGTMDIGVQMDSGRYELKQNSISLNELDFSLIGHVINRPEETELNLELNAPNNQVSEVLSLIPNIMMEQYDDIESEGTGSINARINGILNQEKGLLPAIDVKVVLENGWVKFPQLKVPIQNLNADIAVTATEPDWADLKVNIPAFAFEIEEDKLTGAIKLTDIYGNPSYNMAMVGNLDMARLSRLFNTGEMNIERGKLSTNFKLETNQQAIDARNYSQMAFSGNARLTGWEVDLASQDPLKFESINVDFNPRVITGNIIDLYFRNTDLTGTIRISDPLLVFSKKGKPKLAINGNSRRLDLDAFQNRTAADTLNYAGTATADMDIPVDLSMDYTIARVDYQDYNITNVKLKVEIKEDRLDIENASLNLDNSPLRGRAMVHPISALMKKDKQINGDIYVNADRVDLSTLISDRDKQSNDLSITVPENLNIKIRFESNNLKFKEFDFRDISGNLNIADGNIELSDTKSKFLDGTASIAGSYFVENGQPYFDFRYNLEQINFQKMISSSEIFKTLAPVAKFIEGFFNSTLVISGPLNDQLRPQLTGITASGFLQTLDAKIAGFRPLVILGEKLGIDRLKSWDLDDSKNWFEIIEGIIYFKERDFNIGDMELKVAGQHTLNQNMNYTIKASIPRELLKTKAIGKEIAFGFDKIEEIANKRGINLDLGENIYLNINLTGNLSNPSISIEPTGSGGESLDELVKKELESKISETRKSIEEEVDKQKEKLKDTLENLVEEQRSRLEREAEKKIDSAKQKQTEDLEKQAKEKAEEMFGKEAKTQIDSIKSKLDDWSPFKKKKNSGY